jgi:hypothetical protein
MQKVHLPDIEALGRDDENELIRRHCEENSCKNRVGARTGRENGAEQSRSECSGWVHRFCEK